MCIRDSESGDNSNNSDYGYPNIYERVKRSPDETQEVLDTWRKWSGYYCDVLLPIVGDGSEDEDNTQADDWTQQALDTWRTWSGYYCKKLRPIVGDVSGNNSNNRGNHG